MRLFRCCRDQPLLRVWKRLNVSDFSQGSDERRHLHDHNHNTTTTPRQHNTTPHKATTRRQQDDKQDDNKTTTRRQQDDNKTTTRRQQDDNKTTTTTTTHNNNAQQDTTRHNKTQQDTTRHKASGFTGQLCVNFFFPDLSGRHGVGRVTGAAKRRREQRLRSMLRHERQTVAMDLAAALHHSRDARSDVAHGALRGQKTASSGMRPEPLEEVAEPQGLSAAPRCPDAGVPLLSVPLLAGRDGIDNTTVRWLLELELRTRQREEEEEEEKKKAQAAETRRRAQALLDHAASLPKRKRKKRRKKKLPRGRARRRQRQRPLSGALIVDSGTGMCRAGFSSSRCSPFGCRQA